MRLLVAIVVAVAGCAHRAPPAPAVAASAPRVAPPAPSVAPSPEPPPRHGERGAHEPIALPHRAVDSASGDELSDRALDDALRAARVIYVGEEHPNPHHHAAELELLERAFAVDPSLGLGLEMLPRTLQAPLDGYLSGALDEAAFLRAVDWEHTWGFDWGFYRPLLAFCRAHRLPAFALNAPRALAHAVAQRGLDGLTADERRALPELQPGPARHRELVREAYAQHPHGKFDEAGFERFYAAQLVWDETMAQQVAAALSKSPAPAHLLVIAGELHTRPFAVPDRAARRGAKPYLTVLPVLDVDEADARQDRVAQILWVLRSR